VRCLVGAACAGSGFRQQDQAPLQADATTEKKEGVHRGEEICFAEPFAFAEGFDIAITFRKKEGNTHTLAKAERVAHTYPVGFPDNKTEKLAVPVALAVFLSERQRQEGHADAIPQRDAQSVAESDAGSFAFS